VARKLKTPAAETPPGAPATTPGEDDLAILIPDIPLTLAGRSVTVREPRFIQGMRIRAKAHALTRDLTASIQGGEGLTDDVMDVLSRHDALVKELICEVTENADIDWIDGLSEIDGEKLMLAWWACCGPFFVRQIARRLADTLRTQALVNAASAMRTSSKPSPQPDTALQASSGSATPNAN
jgi:hypothetical protein